jgi:subtilisin family serine protease
VLDVRTALRRVPGGSGDERWSMPLWDFADLLADYQDAGVAVLNLSVGVATDDGRAPLVLERAIAQLTPSTVVVAAAGNHGEPHAATDRRPAPNAALFPAALDNVIAVGALDGTGAAAFTPRGAGQADTAPWINVFAPGVDVVSTYLGDGAPERVLVENADGSRSPVEFSGWAAWSGTSFATGVITGAVANLLAQGDSPQDAVKKVQAAYPRPEQSTDA